VNDQAITHSYGSRAHLESDIKEYIYRSLHYENEGLLEAGSISRDISDPWSWGALAHEEKKKKNRSALLSRNALCVLLL
jgi:hypothetical protein